MKKVFWIGLALVLSLGGTAVSSAVAQEDAVLLVTPSRYLVMQVAFDVARRYPTVLVSYQGAPEEPVLHVWNGYEWMPLSLADYQSGAFLQSYPARTIFLGDDSLLPKGVRSISTWCSRSTQIPGLETAELVNGIGRYLPFTPADWRWFAGRYNLKLANLKAAEEEAIRKETWYDESGPVKDPAPGFFKYFTRSRHSRLATSDAPMEPVTVFEGEVVETPVP